MGGSFSDIGRHNPLEPTLFKKPIVIGPNMSDFVEVIQ
ncbi:MAG: 3-deoxy-D-manno-octulosonic-acid transferase [Colwellia sp.]|jgi:3-deoxy-D-manno-octulosonic-acid transferase